MATKSTTKPDTPPQGDTIAVLRVTATRDGYRRAGRAWSTEPTFVREGELDKAQIEALQADPQISLAPDLIAAPAEAEG